MTLGQLTRLVGADRAAQWHDGIGLMLQAASATTTLRAAHLLAQVLHETAGLRVTVENLNYSAEGLLRTWPTRFTRELAERLARNPVAIANHAYGGRMGNDQPGDGWKFRGRGCIQLTGRSNYTRYSGDASEGFAIDPEPVAISPHAALAAAWYWNQRGINRLADADDLEGVTRAVNGGLNGLQDRAKWLASVKGVLRPEKPERLGEYELLVLHGLNVRNILTALDAVLDGDGTAVMGRVVASATGGRKLDVRFTE